MSTVKIKREVLAEVGVGDFVKLANGEEYQIVKKCLEDLYAFVDSGGYIFVFYEDLDSLLSLFGDKIVEVRQTTNRKEETVTVKIKKELTIPVNIGDTLVVDTGSERLLVKDIETNEVISICPHTYLVQNKFNSLEEALKFYVNNTNIVDVKKGNNPVEESLMWES